MPRDSVTVRVILMAQRREASKESLLPSSGALLTPFPPFSLIKEDWGTEKMRVLWNLFQTSQPTGDASTKLDLGEANPDKAGFACCTPTPFLHGQAARKRQWRQEAQNAKRRAWGLLGHRWPVTLLIHSFVHLFMCSVSEHLPYASPADMAVKQTDAIPCACRVRYYKQATKSKSDDEGCCGEKGDHRTRDGVAQVAGSLGRPCCTVTLEQKPAADGGAYCANSGGDDKQKGQ